MLSFLTEYASCVAAVPPPGHKKRRLRKNRKTELDAARLLLEPSSPEPYLLFQPLLAPAPLRNAGSIEQTQPQEHPYWCSALACHFATNLPAR
jgi:hypothetical protein